MRLLYRSAPSLTRVDLRITAINSPSYLHKMPRMTSDPTRPIIEDFATKIQSTLLRTPRPKKEVINFRTDRQDRKERDVVRVRCDLLRYRKENGRIASDVQNHEWAHGTLNEADSEDQKHLADFLAAKDPEKTRELSSSIRQHGQQAPAIVTYDGFIINGNRRKMVLDSLYDELREDQYRFMNVVILPGPNDEGGPPTLVEIEKLENRYQLQREGKSEYYGLDQALSIQRKIDTGFSLEDQLRDDPQYAHASANELKKALRKYQKEYLDPLKCADAYLEQFDRKGQYKMISTGPSDREGRWQALKDYARTRSSVLQSASKRAQWHIPEDEVGEIQTAAFHIIRQRVIPELGKVHTIMRNLHKYCSSPDGRRAILGIAKKVEATLPESECIGEDGLPLSPADIDHKWTARNEKIIRGHTRRAARSYLQDREQETPLTLLEAAYKKLDHKDMVITNIVRDQIRSARRLMKSVYDKVDALEKALFDHEKTLKRG